MGYSDVSITMKKEDYDKFTVEISNAKESLKDSLITLMQNAKIYHHKEYDFITIKFEWVKWYEHFDYVCFIRNFLTGVDDYLFNIIGENYDGIEAITTGDYSDDMFEVNRIDCTINIDTENTTELKFDLS